MGRPLDDEAAGCPDAASGVPDLPGVRMAVDWLVEGARTVHQPQDVLAELCARLTAAGVPLARVAVFVTTLHPNVMGRRFLWHHGEAVRVDEADYGMLESDTYRRSSVVVVFQTGQSVRLRLCDPNCPNDFNIVDELRADGITDYLIAPLPFTDGSNHAISWTTMRPGGFTEAHLRALEAVRAPLARVAEIYAARRIAGTLLSTYVGHDAGARILGGRIRRGDIERIDAVILLADLRGFTTISNQRPGAEVIGLLNRFFDSLVPAIDAAGGEVLKFIGDGLLAIFRVAGDPAAACAAALTAVAEADAALAAGSDESPSAAELRYGIALHLGEVLYGNIGSSSRLDFTTIGPAVNLTARLEKLAGELDLDLVLSAAFAAKCQAPTRSLGAFALRGFDRAQEVFALAEA